MLKGTQFLCYKLIFKIIELWFFFLVFEKFRHDQPRVFLKKLQKTTLKVFWLLTFRDIFFSTLSWLRNVKVTCLDFQFKVENLSNNSRNVCFANLKLIIWRVKVRIKVQTCIYFVKWKNITTTGKNVTTSRPTRGSCGQTRLLSIIYHG